MILIDNNTNAVIISADAITLENNHAIANGRRHYGVSLTTHTLIDNVSVPKGHASWWRYINEQFELSDARLSEIKDRKIADLKQQCKNAIESGFISNCLGNPHRYDSQLPQDQINLMGAAMSGQDRLFTCTDVDTGIKSQKLHTASQLQQLFVDAAEWVQTNKDNFWAKVADVNSATNASEIAAI